MKIFHTADWHLGKILQGVHLTEDQSAVIANFISQVKTEKPDCIIIAGDLYDRAVPPPEAVQLLNDTLHTLVIELGVPVIAIAGNHDSPSRLQFGSGLMREQGLYIVGQYALEQGPVILRDEVGEVHFHLVPYMEPSTVRYLLKDDNIISHDDAMKAIIAHMKPMMDEKARHVFVGHAFVTPYGEKEENTSDAEKPLSIGGAEYVNAAHFDIFHYTALGHLHQAHFVKNEHIRYAGSPYKYSISEEHHKKGFYVVELDENGVANMDKRLLEAKRDIRKVEASMDEILKMEVSEDYIFVTLTDETPVLSPMEKIRTVFPNAMHVERKYFDISLLHGEEPSDTKRTEMSDQALFEAFYREVTGKEVNDQAKEVFTDLMETYVKQTRDI